MLTDEPEGDATSLDGGRRSKPNSRRVRMGRRDTTRLSIASLSSVVRSKLTTQAAKSDKPTQACTRISVGKSSDAFSEAHSQCSLRPLSQDQLIQQLQQENARYQRLLAMQLAPLQQRYQQLCQDYTSKLTVLDRLQTTFMMSQQIGQPK